MTGEDLFVMMMMSMKVNRSIIKHKVKANTTITMEVSMMGIG